MSDPAYSQARLPQLTPARTAVVWCLVATLNIALLLAGGFDQTRVLDLAITACAVAFLLTLYTVAFRVLLAVSRYSLLRLSLLTIASGIALWVVDVLVQAWARGDYASAAWAGSFFRSRYNWGYFTLFLVLPATGAALIGYGRALETRNRQLVEARLAALRFQLNPHFLFNTLNVISGLVAESGAVQAEELIARLSTCLRESLSGESTVLVTLAYELDTIQAYLDIESVRFADRLLVTYACEPGLAIAQVPRLILQPLVENAMKFALARSKERVTVSIEAAVDGNTLILTVEDDGRHQSAIGTVRGTGQGLSSVAARLRAIYGFSGTLEAVRLERGFKAAIRLPLRRDT